MKKYWSIAFVLLMASYSFPLLAQTQQESHKTVSEHHRTVMEHTAALKDGKAKTPAEMRNHSKMAGEHLTKAHQAHEAMESKMSAAEKAEPTHMAVKKHHTEAMAHHKNLESEVNKPNPNPSKVKEHATKMHESISRAEETHQKTKKQ
jgi:hypothetical protein